MTRTVKKKKKREKKKKIRPKTKIKTQKTFNMKAAAGGGAFTREN